MNGKYSSERFNPRYIIIGKPIDDSRILIPKNLWHQTIRKREEKYEQLTTISFSVPFRFSRTARQTHKRVNGAAIRMENHANITIFDRIIKKID